MTILNAFLIQKSCGSKMMHENFSQEENVTASGISSGRPSPTAVSRVFAAQANTEHAVFLLEV
jgi:hypothetical protein